MHDSKNTRYILESDNVKEGEINAPGFKDGTKLRVIRYPIASFRQIDSILIVNNSENLVNEHGCVVSKKTCYDLGCDINFDAVYLQEVAE